MELYPQGDRQLNDTNKRGPLFSERFRQAGPKRLHPGMDSDVTAKRTAREPPNALHKINECTVTNTSFTNEDKASNGTEPAKGTKFKEKWKNRVGKHRQSLRSKERYVAPELPTRVEDRSDTFSPAAFAQPNCNDISGQMGDTKPQFQQFGSPLEATSRMRHPHSTPATSAASLPSTNFSCSWKYPEIAEPVLRESIQTQDPTCQQPRLQLYDSATRGLPSGNSGQGQMLAGGTAWGHSRPWIPSALPSTNPTDISWGTAQTAEPGTGIADSMDHLHNSPELPSSIPDQGNLVANKLSPEKMESAQATREVLDGQPNGSLRFHRAGSPSVMPTPTGLNPFTFPSSAVNFTSTNYQQGCGKLAEISGSTKRASGHHLFHDRQILPSSRWPCGTSVLPAEHARQEYLPTGVTSRNFVTLLPTNLRSSDSPDIKHEPAQRMVPTNNRFQSVHPAHLSAKSISSPGRGQIAEKGSMLKQLQETNRSMEQNSYQLRVTNTISPTAATAQTPFSFTPAPNIHSSTFMVQKFNETARLQQPGFYSKVTNVPIEISQSRSLEAPASLTITNGEAHLKTTQISGLPKLPSSCNQDLARQFDSLKLGSLETNGSSAENSGLQNLVNPQRHAMSRLPGTFSSTTSVDVEQEATEPSDPMSFPTTCHHSDEYASDVSMSPKSPTPPPYPPVTQELSVGNSKASECSAPLIDGSIPPKLHMDVCDGKVVHTGSAASQSQDSTGAPCDLPHHPHILSSPGVQLGSFSYSERILQGFESLTIEKLGDPNVFSHLERGIISRSLSPSEDIFRKHCQNIVEFLHESVSVTDQLFITSTCFPDQNELNRQLGLRFNPPNRLLRQLPDNLRGTLQDLCQGCRTEFRKRNQMILQLENEVLEGVLACAVEYYRGELEYILVSELPELSEGEVIRVRTVLQARVQDDFLRAVQLNNAAWSTKFTDKLECSLTAEATVDILWKTQAIRNQIERELKEMMEEALDRKGAIPHREHSKLLEITNPIKETLQLFEKQLNAWPEAVPRSSCLFEKYKQKLVQRIETHMKPPALNTVRSHSSASSGPSSIQNEALEAALAVGSVHNFAHPTRTPSEMDRVQTHTETPENAPDPFHSLSSGSSISDNTTVGVASAGKGGGEFPREGRSQRESQSIEFLKQPDDWLAISIGMRRTCVGTVPKGDVKDFRLIHKQKNLFFLDEDAQNMTLESSAGKVVINLEDGVLTDDIDRVYEYGRHKLKFRLEQLFARFLWCLKSRAEIEVMTQFHCCAIAVPQALNTHQRRCIENAAHIAGFTRIMMLDDTVATVLSYMLQWRSGKLVNTTVVIDSGNFFDLAVFRVKQGMVERTALGGTYFPSDQKSSSSQAVRNVFRKLGRSKEEKNKSLKSELLKEALEAVGWRGSQTILLVGADDSWQSLDESFVNQKSLNYLFLKPEEWVAYGVAFVADLASSVSQSTWKLWQTLFGYTGKIGPEDLLSQLLQGSSFARRTNLNRSKGTVMDWRFVQRDREWITTTNAAQLHKKKLVLLVHLAGVLRSHRDEGSGARAARNDDLLYEVHSLHEKLKKPEISDEELRKLQERAYELTSGSYV